MLTELVVRHEEHWTGGLRRSRHVLSLPPNPLLVVVAIRCRVRLIHANTVVLHILPDVVGHISRAVCNKAAVGRRVAEVAPGRFDVNQFVSRIFDTKQFDACKQLAILEVRSNAGTRKATDRSSV